jgi:uncharacterized protein with FMN-binding domain
MKNKTFERLTNIILFSLLLMAAVSHNGKLFGYKTKEFFEPSEKEKKIEKPTAEQLHKLGVNNFQLVEVSNGVWETNELKLINTNAYGSKVYGFGGPVPLLVLIDSDNRIKNVVDLPNDETPDFFESLKKEGVISQWFGKKATDLDSFQPDAISGATLSSNAVNLSISKTLAKIGKVQPKAKSIFSNFDIKTAVALLVLVSALLLSIYAKSNKRLRDIQLLINVLVLGFWCAKFISFQILLGWFANGVNISTSIVILLMLILSIGLQFFTKNKSFYCTWVCPFGSAQELAGKLYSKKAKIGRQTMNILQQSKKLVTLLVFFSLWVGLASDIVDYEPFTAFVFQHASIAVLIIAGLSIITSIFIKRPWCRFVCPTGQLLQWTNKMN